MQYLYENQGIDFDDVRADIVRYFGPGHSVTIHDGDACTLFDTIPGFYCAGTIRGSHGHTVATFAIDYVTDPTDDSNMRHVVGLHFGPPGYWCRSQIDLPAVDEWVDGLRGCRQPA